MNTQSWIIILLAAATVILGIKCAYNKNDASSTEKTDDGGDAAYECIMTRTSVRQYSDAAVPDSLIEKVLRAGMAAPSAANAQPWELVVITDQALKDSIAATFMYAKPAAKAAFAVVVCGNEDTMFKGDTRESGYWIQDCSAVSENMLLAAHALGMGGVWCGIYPLQDRVKDLRKILSLPDNLEPLNVICFGYPNAATTPKQKWDPAKVHYNSF